MVVVLIIGILIAIALPTFLRARTRAQNRAAQSSLRNVLVEAKTIYTDNSSYAAANEQVTGLESVEPSLDYVAAGTVLTTASTSVGVSAASGTWGAARMSASGTCYSIKDVALTGTTYGSGGTCSGTGALTSATGTSFP